MRIQINTKKIAYLGVMSTVALMFSYVELVIPFNIGIPGVKLGLANIITLIALYLFGYKETIIITILRIVLSSILFSSFYSMIYSISGAFFSLIIMIIFKLCNKNSIYGVSMAGGMFHNIGQLFVASFIVQEIKITYYGPILLVSGIITGFFIGIISAEINKRLETYVRLC